MCRRDIGDARAASTRPPDRDLDRRWYAPTVWSCLPTARPRRCRLPVARRWPVGHAVVGSRAAHCPGGHHLIYCVSRQDAGSVSHLPAVNQSHAPTPFDSRTAAADRQIDAINATRLHWTTYNKRKKDRIWDAAAAAAERSCGKKRLAKLKEKTNRDLVAARTKRIKRPPGADLRALEGPLMRRSDTRGRRRRSWRC